MLLEVRGHHHTWLFEFYGDPAHITDWLADGLEVREVANTIPDWVPWWGVKPWCFLQDLVNFRNPSESRLRT